VFPPAPRLPFFDRISSIAPLCSHREPTAHIFHGDRMKLSSTGSVAVVCILGVFAAAAGCGSKGSPAAPSASPSPVVTMKVETPVLKSPTSGLQVDTLKPTLSVGNAVVAGSVGTVTYEFEVSEMDGAFLSGHRRPTRCPDWTGTAAASRSRRRRPPPDRSACRAPAAHG